MCAQCSEQESVCCSPMNSTQNMLTYNKIYVLNSAYIRWNALHPNWLMIVQKTGSQNTCKLGFDLCERKRERRKHIQTYKKEQWNMCTVSREKKKCFVSRKTMKPKQKAQTKIEFPRKHMNAKGSIAKKNYHLAISHTFSPFIRYGKKIDLQIEMGTNFECREERERARARRQQ